MTYAARIHVSFTALASVALAYACGGPADDVLRILAPADAADELPEDGSAADVAADVGGDAGGPDALVDAAADVDVCVGKDLSSDPDHCGACFRSCLGSACSDGGCSAVLVATTTQPGGVAVDDSRLFFTTLVLDGGGIYSLRKDGADRRTVLEPVQAAQRLALDDNFIAYTTAGAPGVARVGYDGLGAQVLAKTNGSPTELVLDGTDVFVADEYTHSVRKAPVMASPDAAAAPPFVSNVRYARGIAIFGDDVVWSSRGTFVPADGGTPGAFSAFDGTIGARPKDGSAPARTLAAAQGDPFTVAADATGIYWVNLYGRQVMRLAPGDVAPTVLASNQPTPFGLTLDATHVYFTCIGDVAGKGIVARVRKDGAGAVDVLASDLSFPSSIANDDRAVYWANTHGNTIMKVAK